MGLSCISIRSIAANFNHVCDIVIAGGAMQIPIAMQVTFNVQQHSHVEKPVRSWRIDQLDLKIEILRVFVFARYFCA